MFAHRRPLQADLKSRACSHGVGGGGRGEVSRVSEVPRLPVVEKASLYMQKLR